MKSSQNPLQYAKKYIRLILFALAGFALMSVLGFVLVVVLFFSYVIKPLFNGGQSTYLDKASITTVESIKEEHTDSLENKVIELEKRIEVLETETEKVTDLSEEM